MRTFAFIALAASMLAPITAAGAAGTPGAASSGRYNWGGHSAWQGSTGGGMQGRHWNQGGNWQHGGGNWNHGGGNWNHQGGWNHARFRRGHVLPRFWLSPTFFVSNWNSYGFGRPGYGQNWVRYYDDALLVDSSGRIYDTAYDVDWDRYEHGPVPEYYGDDDDGPDEADLFYEDDRVTWGGRYSARYPAYAAPIVIVQSAPVVTTATTTYIEEEVRPRQRSWKAKRRAHKCRCK